MINIELFLEIEKHLLEDEKPSIYLLEQLANGNFDEYPFSMIKDLESIEQNPQYHPEGNVFLHTMMVVDEGAKNREKSNFKRGFMWALLLHDIGKKPTTKIRKGRITSYDHDKIGAKMAEEFLRYFEQDKQFIDSVASLIRWHMQILFVTKNLKFANVKEMVNKVDKNEIALVSLCDRLGRGKLNFNSRQNIMDEVNNFKKIINIQQV